MTSGVQAEIANMVQRTFFIRYFSSIGTAFVIEEDEHQYLVTAKHMVVTGNDRIQQGETVRLYGDDGQAMVLPVESVAACDGDPDHGGIDVAVLGLSRSFHAPKSPAWRRPWPSPSTTRKSTAASVPPGRRLRRAAGETTPHWGPAAGRSPSGSRPGRRGPLPGPGGGDRRGQRRPLRLPVRWRLVRRRKWLWWLACVNCSLS